MAKTVNPDDFESRWEYSKATSDWHFDPRVNEDINEPFTRVGRFLGMFEKDIREMEPGAEPNTFENRTKMTPYTKRLDQNDLRKAGYGEHHVLFDKVRRGGLTPKMLKMAEYFGLDHWHASIHYQRPGQFFPFHIDNLTTLRQNRAYDVIDEDPHKAIRFVIMLTDWDWGHFWQYGNTMWKQWRAGDIVSHHWRDIPHATGNAGFTTRVSLQVTGMRTEKTDRILTQGFHEIPL